MTVGDQVELYTAVLLLLWDEPDVYGAVAALIARDAQSRWWAEVA
jgi:hypothetical protein